METINHEAACNWLLRQADIAAADGRFGEVETYAKAAQEISGFVSAPWVAEVQETAQAHLQWAAEERRAA